MKRFIATAIFGALLAAPALAQQGPPAQGAPGKGPAPEMRQQMMQARSEARTHAFAALSKKHQAKIQGIIADVKSGKTTDARAAARQIDDILSGTEAAAVLTARDEAMGGMHRRFLPQDEPRRTEPAGDKGLGADQAGQPGPQVAGRHEGAPPESPPRDRRHESMRNDAGFALLALSLDRNEMHTLFAHR
jgi:hypothetical protein